MPKFKAFYKGNFKKIIKSDSVKTENHTYKTYRSLNPIATCVPIHFSVTNMIRSFFDFFFIYYIYVRKNCKEPGYFLAIQKKMYLKI